MTKQQYDTKPELIFWLDAPPRSIAGVLRYVAQEWGGKVYYLCVRSSLSKERKTMGWEDCDHGKAKVLILSEKPDTNRFVREFLQEHGDAIHICSGFRSLSAKFTKKWLFSVPDARIVMWSERPGVFESKKKQFITYLGLTDLLHRYYALRYGPKIGAYLALGTLTIKTLTRLNWDRKILFPFMYDSHISASLPKKTHRQPGEPLRFLYVGRFGRPKGVDVLVRTFEKQQSEDWQLDLVGRHGEYEKQIVEWAHRHPRVSYLGVWSSSEVIKRMAQYDVCLVPSRFDGWGLATNEAIHAGIGVIVTDATASYDLVRASGAGLVIPAGNVDALRKSTQLVIDDPALADSWKEKARAYSHKITSESIGRYLIAVLKYTFLDSLQPKPKCPWL